MKFSKQTRKALIAKLTEQGLIELRVREAKRRPKTPPPPDAAKAHNPQSLTPEQFFDLQADTHELELRLRNALVASDHNGKARRPGRDS